MWVAVLLAALASEGRAAETGTVFGDTAVVHAMEALAQGDEARALDLLHSVLTPERRGVMWSEARFVAARAALGLGRSQEALALSDKLEVELPEVADHCRALRARAWRQNSDWQNALAEWQKLINEFSSSPLVAEARYGVADAYFALGKSEQALTGYERALRESSRNDRAAAARYNLGRLAELTHDWSTAAGTYSYIVYYMPTDPMSLAAQQRLDELVAVGQAQPASSRKRLVRIDKLLAARLIEQADQELRELEAGGALKETSIAYRRGQIAYRQQRFDVAVAVFSELVRQTTGWRRLEYQRWLARAQSSADNLEAAIDEYLDIASHYRHRFEGREALYKAAWLAYSGRQHERATDLFGQFVARYPWDGAADEALWYMAWNAYRLGDLPTSLEALAKLRKSYPRSTLLGRTYYWAGRIYEQLGRGVEASAAYQEAMSGEGMTYYGVLARGRLEELRNQQRPVAFAPGATQFASLEVPERTADEALVPEPDAEPTEAGQDGEVVPRDLHGEEAPEPGKAPEVLAPGRDELPEHGGLRPVEEEDALPWGSSSIEWGTADGKRALRLMTLGLHEEAAKLVNRLRSKPGFDSESVSYARARVLYALGDFNTAHHIASSVFAEEMRGEPRGKVRQYFHIAYPEAHRESVQAAAQQYGISPLLVLAVMRQESAFHPRARSTAAARGLMQIIPATGRRIAQALGEQQFAVQTLDSPEVSIRFGTWYLSQLMHKFHGNLVAAIAAYNSGPQAVTHWIDVAGGRATDEFVEEIPFRETRNYVRRVLGNLAVYSEVYDERPLTLPDTLAADYLDALDF